MHRLNEKLRKEVLTEVTRLTNRYLIISYSEVNLIQRLKQRILTLVNPSHVAAPESIPLKTMLDEMTSEGLKIIKFKRIVYFLSAKILFLAMKTSENSQ